MISINSICFDACKLKCSTCEMATHDTDHEQKMSAMLEPVTRKLRGTLDLPLSAEGESVLAQMNNRAQVLRFPRRQRVPITDTAHHTLVVKTGLIAVCAAPAGRHVIVEFLYPGDFVIPSAGAPLPDLTLSASAPAECWRFSAAQFAAGIAGNDAFATYAVERLAIQRTRAQFHVAALAALTSEERVAAALLEGASLLTGITGPPASGTHVSFESPWSRTEIASYLALNADTLSRIMCRLTEARIIARSGRSWITILDWKALRSMCPLAEAAASLHR